jgi:hypothetical protein
LRGPSRRDVLSKALVKRLLDARFIARFNRPL